MPSTTTESATIIEQLAEQFAPVLEGSPDGVYLWLDETHKVCNEKLAAMFGYSIDEWCAASPFLDSFIDEADRATYSSGYHTTVAGNGSPRTFRFTGIRKDGTRFAAETDMVPVAHAGRLVAYHFVRTV